MDSRPLNELHDTRYEYIVSVADGVYFDFLALDVLVYKYRLVLVDLYSGLEVMPELLLIAYDLHRTSAEYERRSYEHRISDLSCCPYTVLDSGDCTPRWLRDAKLFEHFLESVSVLSSVDRFAVGSDELYTSVSQRLCEVDGCLAAECSDNALRLLEIDDSHYILDCQRLKVQLVSCSVVCRNSLRVVVYDDCLVAGALDGLYCVYCRVVELYTLTDPDRACSENDDLLLVSKSRFVLTCV